MTGDLDKVMPLIQLGFAGLMAVLLWRGYEKLTGTVLQVVQDNTTAMAELKSVITEHTDATERMRLTVEALDRRVGSLEHESERSRR